jgi:hypothetical protein
MVRSIRIADHDRTRVASEPRQRSLDQIGRRLAVEGRTAGDYVVDQAIQIEAAAPERRVEMGRGASQASTCASLVSTSVPSRSRITAWTAEAVGAMARAWQARHLSLERPEDLPPQKVSQERARQEIAGRSHCSPRQRRSASGFRRSGEPCDQRDHDEKGSHPLPPRVGDIQCISAGRE